MFLKQTPTNALAFHAFRIQKYEKRSAPQANEGDSRKSQPNFSIRRKCRYERFDAEPGHNQLELSLDRKALLSICIHRTLHRKEKIILELLKIIKREFKKVRAGVSPRTQEFHEWPLSCPLKKSHTIKFDARPCATAGLSGPVQSCGVESGKFLGVHEGTFPRQVHPKQIGTVAPQEMN